MIAPRKLGLIARVYDLSRRAMRWCKCEAKNTATLKLDDLVVELNPNGSCGVDHGDACGTP